MPTRKRGISRIIFELTDAQRLELVLGTGGGGSHFEDDEECEAAWQQHRAVLLEESRPGTRPWAWWRYECPRPWGSFVWASSGEPCKPVHEAIELVALGAVDDTEMAAIEASWAKQDAQAHAEAALAARVNGVSFTAALECNRQLRGVPTDRPVLADYPAVSKQSIRERFQ